MPPGFNSGAKRAQDARQFAARHMKKRRIGEDSVKVAFRQIEREKILQPHLATAVDARHFDEARRAVESDRDMPKLGERLQIASGPATEIEQREGRLAANVTEHRRDILCDVVAARPLPESLGALIVMSQRDARDRFQIVRAWSHCDASEQSSRHRRRRKHQAKPNGSRPAVLLGSLLVDVCEARHDCVGAPRGKIRHI